MNKRKDISGKTFGYLTAIRFHHSDGKHTYWEFKCRCGNIVVKRTDHLNETFPSCGCYVEEQFGYNPKEFDYESLKKTRIYRTWKSMIARCSDKNNKYYGAKGIKVCKSWAGEHGFKVFYRWAIKNGYRDDLTIDRINPNYGYSAKNCGWVDEKVQSNNRTNTIYIYHNGETITLTDFSDRTGISKKDLYKIIHRKKVLSSSYIFSKIK